MRLLAHICDCECVLVCKAIQSCIWLEPPGRNGRQCNPGGNCLVTRCLLANIPRKQAHVHGLHCTEAVAEVAANTLPIIASLLPSTSHRSASWLIIYLQLTFYKPRTSPSHTHTHAHTYTHSMRLRPPAAIWFHKYLQSAFALSFFHLFRWGIREFPGISELQFSNIFYFYLLLYSRIR